VADEVTKLKGFRTRQGGKRAKAIAEVAHKKVDRWIGLTGTPAPNGLKDLWGPMWFVDGGQRLGKSFTAFSRSVEPADATTVAGLDPMGKSCERLPESLAPIDEPHWPHKSFSPLGAGVPVKPIHLSTFLCATSAIALARFPPWRYGSP